MQAAKLPIAVDKFGYADIKDFIRELCKACTSKEDTHHLVKEMKDLVKKLQLKEGKVACSEWKALWLPNKTRLAKSPVRKTNYISVKKLAETVTRPITFRDYMVAESFRKSVAACRDDSEKFELQFSLPSKESVAYLCNFEIATNYDLAAEMITRQRYKKYTPMPRGMADNLMHICDTPAELGIKRSIWLENVAEIYRLHGASLDDREIVRLSDARGMKDFQATKDGRLVHALVKGKVASILDSLGKLEKDGKLLVFIGPPGSGKTYQAEHAAAETSLLWSLSNTVALNGAARVRKVGKKCKAMSFEKVRFLDFAGALMKEDARDILIDETSQLGVNDLDIIQHAVDFVKASGGKIIMMGDINQIPSFLSRGSVLYSIIHQFSKATKVLSGNHRVDEGARMIADRSVMFAGNGKTADFAPFCVDKLPESIFVMDKDRVFITGSNKQTNSINAHILNCNVPGVSFKTDGSNPCDELREPDMRNTLSRLLQFMEKKSIEFIATETETIGEDKKIMTNERFWCVYNGHDVVATSRVESGKELRLPVNTFLKFFAPAYAINVNKAQGLEWDHVILTFGDIFPRKEVGTGNYLLRSSFEHFYVGVTRARKSLTVFIGDEDHATLTPVNKFNIFEEVN